MRNLAIAYILATCVFVPWYNYEPEPPKEIEPIEEEIDYLWETQCGNYT